MAHKDGPKRPMRTHHTLEASKGGSAKNKLSKAPTTNTKSDMIAPTPKKRVVSKKKVSKAQPYFRFRELPVELRLEIYRYCLRHLEPISMREPKGLAWKKRALRIMTTCKDIYNEAAPVAFGENVFVVHYPKGGKNDDMFHGIGDHTALHIKKIITFDMGPLVPLNKFENLQTLEFASKVLFRNRNKPAPEALAVGSTVTLKDLSAVRMKHKWDLPNPPEQILDRCRAKTLTITFVAGFRLRYVPKIGHGIHAWSFGRVDTYSVVVLPKNAGQTRRQYAKDSAFGLCYDLVLVSSELKKKREDMPQNLLY
ncbi:hypothetical protein BLS_009233 [Venturia inaequalis]|uniref:F-box domain-containing protein n=1 Tax=Venturia inaequalis TaxID=5025 RepID=A0A8H3U8E6_VENIN|nr:hypothetical protein EG328_010075 [Venturia inaequalis]KAE9980051.1 hypothetical protein BLS_009233 [Venturia inaequalis]RDI80554.1 Gamma-glutamyltransferase [Venturia inaequalis]